MLLLLKARPSEIRVIPPSRVVSIAGEVIIVQLWLILLLGWSFRVLFTWLFFSSFVGSTVQGAAVVDVCAWRGCRCFATPFVIVLLCCMILL